MTAPVPERLSPGKAAQQARKQIGLLDEKMKKLGALISRVDAALVDWLALRLARSLDPNAYSRDPGKAGQLAQQRAELQRALTSAEDEWLALTSEFEAAGSG